MADAALPAPGQPDSEEIRRHRAELQRRIQTTIATREKHVQTQYEYATKVGLRPDGEPISGDDAAANLQLYGATCPREHYCSTMPLLTLPDLAKTWEVSETIIRGWHKRGDWELIRQEWLNTIPVEHGGTRISGDLEKHKEFFVTACLTDLVEAQRITMARMRARAEDAATGIGVARMDKTSAAHLADVQALKTIIELGRVTLGMPTKVTFSAQHSTSQRLQVNETVIRAPSEDPAKAFDVEGDINPPSLGAMVGTQQSREFLAESSEIVEASYGDDNGEESLEK